MLEARGPSLELARVAFWPRAQHAEFRGIFEFDEEKRVFFGIAARRVAREVAEQTQFCRHAIGMQDLGMCPAESGHQLLSIFEERSDFSTLSLVRGAAEKGLELRNLVIEPCQIERYAFEAFHRGCDR